MSEKTVLKDAALQMFCSSGVCVAGTHTEITSFVVFLLGGSITDRKGVISRGAGNTCEFTLYCVFKNTEVPLKCRNNAVLSLPAEMTF